MSARQLIGDFIDAPIAFVFTASALWATGFLTQVNNFLFTEAWSYSTLSLNYAGLIGFVGLFFAYLANDRSLSDFSDIETMLAVALLVVHTLISFVPSIRTAITGSTSIAVVLFLVYALGYGVLSASWGLDEDKNPLGGVLG